MKKILLLILTMIALISCKDKSEDKGVIYIKVEPKRLTVGEEKYIIEQASDSCEYYSMYIATGAYTGANRYFHYPQCSYCKTHK